MHGCAYAIFNRAAETLHFHMQHEQVGGLPDLLQLHSWQLCEQMDNTVIGTRCSHLGLKGVALNVSSHLL